MVGAQSLVIFEWYGYFFGGRVISHSQDKNARKYPSPFYLSIPRGLQGRIRQPPIYKKRVLNYDRVIK